MCDKVTCRIPLFLIATVVACSTTPDAVREPVQPLVVGVGSVAVQIVALRTATGQINVSLFSDEAGFPNDSLSVFRSAKVQASEGGVVAVVFDSLSYGEYAIAVLHDENGNGVMDTGFMGIPSEGFAFSNNPRPGFGAPSFESCSFRLDQAELVLQLEMRYF